MARSTADVTTSKTTPPVIGPLDDKDLPEAERILRLAFGTFLGAPDPETFWSDRDYVYGRQQSPHAGSASSATAILPSIANSSRVPTARSRT
jgi:hypothetical protein